MEFTKIHGLGNDYIYIDNTTDIINNPSELTTNLCDRHIGVGADGTIFLLKSNVADFKMEIFNADGSEAEMCGNGIRGLGKYIYEKKLSNKKNLKIETKCGIKKLWLDVLNNEVINVTVDMGKIITNPTSIPVNLKKILNQKVDIDNKSYIINCISIGNPHCVLFTDNVSEYKLDKIGPKLENNPLFPNKTNVEFVEIIDKNNIKMKVWERGSGETLACGTGACASVVISYLTGKTYNKCRVHLAKGILNIYYNNLTKHVFLSGPSETVFEGYIKKRYI